MMFLGEHQLKSLYFSHDVLKRYVDNPSYHFQNNDVLLYTICANDDFEDNDGEYIQCALACKEDGTKVITAFLCDLAKMPVKAQRYWENFLIDNKCFLYSDYVTSQLEGQFYKGASIYQALLDEMKIINEQCAKIGLPTMFRKTFALTDDEMREFRPLVNATSKEFLNFAQLLHKIVVGQMNVGTFQKTIGVIRGLSSKYTEGLSVDQKLILWLKKNVSKLPKKDLDLIESAFEKLGKDRNFQAHEIYRNCKKNSLNERQKDLMYLVYVAVRQIRLILQNHPDTKSIVIPDCLITGEHIQEY